MTCEAEWWQQVCGEIATINATLPEDKRHHIPTCVEWCDYFKVAANEWVEFMEPVNIVGIPEFIDDLPTPSPEGEWFPWSSGDYLPALRHPGRLATKRFTWQDGEWKKESYHQGKVYDVYLSPEITSLESLSAALMRLESEPEYFVVRGEQIKPGRVERTYLDGNFACVDRRWLMVDIDEVDGADISDAIAILPDYMRAAACWYQYSSSAGMQPGKVKVHLWYWLDRPVCCFSLRQWAKSLKIIDPMIYNPVQPHFTARPIIIGAPDPMPNRSGLLPGNPELVLPPEVVDLATYHQQLAEAEAARLAARPKRTIESAFAATDRQRYATKALANACDDIRTAGKGNRHLTIISRAIAIGEMLEHLDEGLARAELTAAAMDALSGDGRAREAEKTILDGLERGKRNPRDLSHIGVVELPPKLDREIDEMLKKLKKPEAVDMRYIRICLTERRPYSLPYHYDPELFVDELVWYPGDDHVEPMAYELSVDLSLKRRKVASVLDLPPINESRELA